VSIPEGVAEETEGDGMSEIEVMWFEVGTDGVDTKGSKMVIRHLNILRKQVG